MLYISPERYEFSYILRRTSSGAIEPIFIRLCFLRYFLIFDIDFFSKFFTSFLIFFLVFLFLINTPTILSFLPRVIFLFKVLSFLFLLFLSCFSWDDIDWILFKPEFRSILLFVGKGSVVLERIELTGILLNLALILFNLLCLCSKDSVWTGVLAKEIGLGLIFSELTLLLLF